MYKKNSIYSINKKYSDAIVYPFANGEEVRITREDFPIEEEFLAFKAWSDENYESYRSGEISREDFIESKDALSVKADELTAKKEQLEKEYQALLKAKQQEAETESEVARAEQVLTDFDAGLHEHLYEAIERVIVTSNEQIEIEWVFEDIFTHKEKYC